MKKMTIREIYEANNQFLKDTFLHLGIEVRQGYCQYKGEKGIDFSFIHLNTHTRLIDGKARIFNTTFNNTVNRAYKELYTKEEIIEIAEKTKMAYVESSRSAMQTIIDKLKQA